MTKSSKFSQAATQLLNNRVAGIKAKRLDKEVRPNNLDDALAIHREMIAQRSDLVAGWKALLPPAENKIVAAPIFAQTVNRGAVCKQLADNNLARIEPEIAFVLGKDLPAQQENYTQEQIDEAVEGCYMALELMQSRFADDSGAEFNEKLADCLVNQGLYIGPKIDKSLAYAASEIAINISQGEDKQSFAGKHPNQLPQNPLYWLINYMSKRGTSFKAGEAVITGSYAGIVEVQFDRATEIEYVGLGRYTVEFKAL